MFLRKYTENIPKFPCYPYLSEALLFEYTMFHLINYILLFMVTSVAGMNTSIELIWFALFMCANIHIIKVKHHLGFIGIQYLLEFSYLHMSHGHLMAYFFSPDIGQKSIITNSNMTLTFFPLSV